MKNNKNFKQIILYITYAVVLCFIFLNFTFVLSALGKVFSVLTPIIYGLILAYLFNFIYEFYNKKCFGKLARKTKRKGFVKPCALISTYVTVIGIVTFLLVILIPEIINSISLLVDNVPAYADTLKEMLNNVAEFTQKYFGWNLYDPATLEKLLTNISKAFTGGNITNFLQMIATGLLAFANNTARNFSVGVYNLLIGVIVSIYVLSSKEKLGSQFKQLVKAYIPEKFSSKFYYVMDISNTKCGRFLVGKIIDSTIIGVLCFIGLSILRIDYAVLISVIIGITNIIPFFGPIVGAIPCAFLLLIISPIDCLLFLVYIICLQQLDGNFIGPKILGNSVGISGFWILFSVIVGGGLFGFAGMVLGVPVFATIYAIVEKHSSKKLKKIKADDDTETNTDLQEDLK